MSALSQYSAGRFVPLMGEALYLASPSAADLSLQEIQSRLLALAEKERALPHPPEPSTGVVITPPEDHGPRMRFAVYAWVDEQMLGAARADAGAWTGLSLQYYYFQTTDAGQLFFEYLHEELDLLNIPGQHGEAELPLSLRMERAAETFRGQPCPEVLAVFARCLLYGFRGRLYSQPDELEKLRKCSLQLIRRDCDIPEEPARETVHLSGLSRVLTPLLCILIPLLGTVLFGIYCSSIMAGIPLPIF